MLHLLLYLFPMLDQPLLYFFTQRVLFHRFFVPKEGRPTNTLMCCSYQCCVNSVEYSASHFLTRCYHLGPRSAVICFIIFIRKNITYILDILCKMVAIWERRKMGRIWLQSFLILSLCCLLNDASSSQAVYYRIIEWLLSNELERVWKEIVMAQSELL